MNRIDNSRFLLYIEPKKEQKSESPVNDHITEVMQKSFNSAKSGTANYSDLNSDGEFTEGNAYKGSHTTDCLQHSSNKDYLLKNGMITNSLCVFYLQYYRNAIPNSEMKKVKALCEWVKTNEKII